MKVTVGVSGGIAAYKAAELVRALQKHALDVHVVMTASAEQFIRPLTFAALTGHKVITGLWSGESDENAVLDSAIEHIAEAQAIDALVVAPATANTLSQFAHGVADDFLGTLYLATHAPVVVAPAMNVNMLNHPATQANLKILLERGVRIVAPGEGYLACGMTGGGRLAESEEIVSATLAALQQHHDLDGETIIVTAGGTREPIDPVRYIGNRSSGKMGYALAEAAQARGARVLLISAPTALRPPIGCGFVSVTTAAAMRDALMTHLDWAGIIIKAAAVSDYRVAVPADEKLKRSGPITLTLEPTEDILREVTEHRKPGTLVIGFAAETADAINHGRAKLESKGVDAIVVNEVNRAGIGFDSDRNAATFLTRQTAIEMPEMTKRELADRILNEIVALRRPRSVMSETAQVGD